MPLLQEGQDPNGLAARVAYHLHTLNISREALEKTGITQELARHLRQGTLPMKPEDVSSLAATLQRDPDDFLREPPEDEKRAWDFYRASARQVTEVWQRVAQASTAHSFSQHRLGKLLDIPQSDISRAIRGERKKPVLNWHDAVKIADALQLPEGAQAFIPRESSKENGPDRG